MVCYVLLLSVFHGAGEVSFGPISWSSPLFLSVQLKPVLQSLLEVTGNRSVLGQSWTCSLQDSICAVGVFEEPTCRKFTCLLSREAKAGRGGSLGFVQLPSA